MLPFTYRPEDAFTDFMAKSTLRIIKLSIATPPPVP